MKILLIGEGHGFQALVDGFSKSKYQISVLSELHDKSNTDTDFKVIRSN